MRLPAGQRGKGEKGQRRGDIPVQSTPTLPLRSSAPLPFTTIKRNSRPSGSVFRIPNSEFRIRYSVVSTFSILPTAQSISSRVIVRGGAIRITVP